MKTARENAQAVRLHDGRVLVIGGDQSIGGEGRPPELELASAELYNPATGKFIATGSMTTPRNDFTATVLTSGKVLVVGGDRSEELASAEIYDPATGRFTATGSVTIARAGQSASLLPNGDVLIALGSAHGPEEVYKPASGQFSATAAVPDGAAPGGLPPVTLLDGRVLFPGTPSCIYWP